jgi:hypothetical protein
MAYNDPKLDAWGPETTVQTISFGSKPKRSIEPVRTNLTNGQLWGIDPVPTQAVGGYEPLWDSDESDYNAPLRPEPLWDSGEGNAPLRTEALWESDETDADAPLRDEPLWDSGGSAWRPVNDMTSSGTGDKLDSWGSEFNDVPQSEFGVDSNIDGSGLQGTSALSTGQGSSPNTTVSSPPTPPSTRPYIWKYQ